MRPSTKDSPHSTFGILLSLLLVSSKPSPSRIVLLSGQVRRAVGGGETELPMRNPLAKAAGRGSEQLCEPGK